MVLDKVLSLFCLLVWLGKDSMGPGTVGMKMSPNEYGAELNCCGKPLSLVAALAPHPARQQLAHSNQYS